ncbi:MAG: hypothetical protein ABJA50_03190, partial [Chloroflexota bacterium]
QQEAEHGAWHFFHGKGQQSIFRAGDVQRLAQDVAGTVRAAGAAAESALQEGAVEDQVPAEPTPMEARRAKRRDAIKLMGTRLSMDSRWAEMSDKDIATWLDALEPVQFERIHKVTEIAIERLQRVQTMMADFEEKARHET